MGTRDRPALVTCEWGIVHHLLLQPPTCPLQSDWGLLKDVAIAVETITKTAACEALGLNGSPSGNFEVKWVVDYLA